MSTIPVVVDLKDEEKNVESGTLGVFDYSSNAGVKHINVEKMKQSISGLSNEIATILSDIKKVGDFKLKQVQLQVEISAEGGFNLIGTAKAGTKGAINLTFADN